MTVFKLTSNQAARFSSLIAIPFALTFPGAFAPTGLLGAGSQSAAWLSVFYRFGFSAATVGYALLIPGKHTKDPIGLSPRPGIFWSVAIVIIVVCALTSAVTAGHDLMPRLLGYGNTISLPRQRSSWRAFAEPSLHR